MCIRDRCSDHSGAGTAWRRTLLTVYPIDGQPYWRSTLLCTLLARRLRIDVYDNANDNDDDDNDNAWQRGPLWPHDPHRMGPINWLILHAFTSTRFLVYSCWRSCYTPLPLVPLHNSWASCSCSPVLEKKHTSTVWSLQWLVVWHIVSPLSTTWSRLFRSRLKYQQMMFKSCVYV